MSIFQRGTAVHVALLLGTLSAPSTVLAESPLELLPGEAEITASDREHWSFRPLVRPPLPPTPDIGPPDETPSGPAAAAPSGDEFRRWCRTPIDQFILTELRRKGLQPTKEADRATFLRRVSFDLTGLPPTLEEQQEFLADDRPDAVERLVDRMLESPAYGERWGQHWLDLARFAETDGFEHDKVRSSAWRYRDWVVNALNEDLPYDQFVALQIAGDELFPGNEEAAQATGFCLAGPDMPDINSQDERKHVLLNEMAGTVGAVFLGLQVGCAQCHDHKYDPVSQADFYRLRAFFEPAVSLQKNQPVSLLQNPAADKGSGEPPPAHVYLRGDWRSPGPAIVPAFLRVANPWGDTVPADAVDSAAGRRTALSLWLTRPDHPLTTRVIVNRVWQFHFGHGLSHTPSDFGLLGDEPLHLNLLDWLACELVEQRWSLKELHRLILTSSVYRLSVEPHPENAGRDPDNRYLAHFERRRLSGEELRDAMFHAAGILDFRRGGPGVLPPLPAELTVTLLKNQWNVSPREADHYRRSLYVFARRNLRYPIFEVFDRPDANASCPERNRSTTAPQSLHLLNSHLSLDAARRLAGVLLDSTTDEAEQLHAAFRRVLGRTPTHPEIARLTQFLTEQRELLAASSRKPEELATPIPLPEGVSPSQGAALTDFALALFNLSEFVYVE